MKQTTQFILRISILGTVLLPNVLFAQAPKLGPPVTAIGSTLRDFIELLVKILQTVGIPLLVVAIIYSGYLLVSAGGNQEQVSKGKTGIFWTLVGAAIILGAQVLADLAFNTAAGF